MFSVQGCGCGSFGSRCDPNWWFQDETQKPGSGEQCWWRRNRRNCRRRDPFIDDSPIDNEPIEFNIGWFVGYYCGNI